MTATPSKFLRADGQRFIDPAGREVILHAINFGWIGCPEDQQCIWWQGRDEEYRRMRDWGFNAVRMPVYWSGIEREPGVYDEEFLDEISQRVQWARDAGLYVILDMHQDLWGNGVPNARGAPEWALIEPDLPHYSSGSVWSMAYFQSPRVQAAFDNFWADAAGHGDPPVGIQARFAAMWQHVAARFKDDPTVIGYDLFNEPFPGTRIEEVMQPMTLRMLPRLVLEKGPKIVKQDAFDIALAGMELAQSNLRLYRAWTDAGASATAKLDRELLAPMYDRVTQAIREVDTDHAIFTSPTITANFGVPTGLPAVRDASGQPDPLYSFAPHAYDDDPARMALIADRLVNHARELGVPLFVGEWGNLTNNDKIFSQDPVPATRELVTRLEAAGASHSFWYYHNDMDTQPWFVEFLQRPYPRTLAGKLVRYSFDASREASATAAFECEWDESAGISEPSEFYVPSLVYGKYYRVELTPAGSTYTFQPFSADTENGLLIVPPTGQGGKRRVRIVR